jgi:hypothetical protein
MPQITQKPTKKVADNLKYRFDPSRWESPTKEMKVAMMPFGGGSRSKFLLYHNYLFLFPPCLTI